MEWFEHLKELIPEIKNYKKFGASISFSFLILVYIIVKNPDKTSFLFANPFLLLIITLAEFVSPFFCWIRSNT